MCKTGKKAFERRTENEITHGKYLSSNDPHKVWNWDSPAGKIRWQRRKKILLDELSENSSVLEIGCGTGQLSGEISKIDVYLTAIDISEDLLAIAKGNNSQSGIHFMVEDACNMTFESGKFDLVIGSSVFHHLDVDSAIREFYRVLKPGGKLVFTEPNMMNPQIALQKNWPYLKRKLGDSPDETAFIRGKLKKQLLKNGFTSVDITPFDFLHPSLPAWLINPFDEFLHYLEKVPVIREIAGSLFIRAIK